MRHRYQLFVFFILPILCLSPTPEQEQDPRFLYYITDPGKITFYWKDDDSNILGSLQNLKTFVERNRHELVFAMNGGMYKTDQSPLGLFIERNRIHAPLNKASAQGNFYLKPNGVFYLTQDSAFVCKTEDFNYKENIKFATQSGPMLLIDGELHPAFKKGSANLNIRNGVGILPDNRVIFAISKEVVNFHDFATFFKRMNCRNALYLDGFVSRAYLPEQNWKQLDGNFGVIIGVTK